MAYIGNEAQTAFTSFDRQLLTGDGTTGPYTLSHSVANEQEIEVFVNYVRQRPGDAYTASGNQLTMTGNVLSTDDFYVVFQGKAVQTVVPPAGSVTDSMITGMASSKLTGALPAIDGSSLTGITNNAGSEYFQVNLTTDQTGITTATAATVDFGGSGTVEYDTASNFDSANDAYLLDSSNGVYMISYSIGIRSNALTTPRIVYAGAAVNIATDGSTFVAHKGSAAQLRGDASDDEGSVTFAGNFIYKATTATTKIKLMGIALMGGSQTWNIETDTGSMIQVTDTGITGAKNTFLSVMRIA